MHLKIKSLIVITLLSLTTGINSCQHSNSTSKSIITAHLEDYTQTPAQLNIMGHFVEPLLLGQVDSSGNLKLELPADFIEITQRAFNKYNTQPDAIYELGAIGINDLFNTSDLINISNPDVELALAGKSYGFETYSNQSISGYLFAASSQQFIQYIIKPDNYVPQLGHHYYWVYSSDHCIISGKQQTDTESVIIFNVNLQPGWNIIKYSIDHVDQENTLHATIAQATYTSIDSYNNIKWIYIDAL